MGNKNIDWQGTLACLVAGVALINVIISIASYIWDDAFRGEIEYRTIMTIMFLLGQYQQGSVVMYEGWYDDDDYEDVYPPENIRWGIRALIVIILLYIFLAP